MRKIPIHDFCAMAEKIAHTLHPEKLDDTPEWSAVEVSADVLVADKWQGNTIDRSEMRMLGRVQVLRVRTPFCHSPMSLTDPALTSATSPSFLCLASALF